MPYLFEKIVISGDLYLTHSDLHILHKNIIHYNTNERVRLIPDEYKDYFKKVVETDDDEGKDNIRIFLANITLKILKEQVLHSNFEDIKGSLTYVNLGDLFFNLRKWRYEELKKTETFQYFLDFLKALKDKGFKTILVDWNHDPEAKLYKEHFDEVDHSLIFRDDKEKSLYYFSHTPLFEISLFEKSVCRTEADENFFHMIKMMQEYYKESMWDKLDKNSFGHALKRVENVSNQKVGDKNKIDITNFSSAFLNFDTMACLWLVKKVLTTGYKTVYNIHWHIHTNPLRIDEIKKESLKKYGFDLEKWLNLSYKNVCIDYLLLEKKC